MGGKPHGKNRVKPPIERLQHCHDKLRQQLDRLVALAETLEEDPSDVSPWGEVEEIGDYLGRSIRRHEDDEEESVFPRLARHPALRPLLTRLVGDHAAQNKQVARLLKATEARKTQGLAERCRVLQRAYVDHIVREDRELLPAMARHLEAEELAELALEMAARRD